MACCCPQELYCGELTELYLFLSRFSKIGNFVRKQLLDGYQQVEFPAKPTADCTHINCQLNKIWRAV